MRQYVEFPLENGEVVVVAVEQPAMGGMVPATGAGAVVRASQTFQEAFARVRPIANAIIAQLSGLSEEPREVEVTFGLTMSAESGVVVAAAGIEANYTVTLKWSRT
jgi:Trypsin-co-occurring domain 1